MKNFKLEFDLEKIKREGYDEGAISINSLAFSGLATHIKSLIKDDPQKLGKAFVRGGADEGMVEVHIDWQKSSNELENIGLSIEHQFSEILTELGQKVSHIRSKLYYNSGITQTRGFHTDGQKEQYKLFIYLTKVELKDGPYTIVPGSQRWYVRKLFSKILHIITRSKSDINSYLFNVRGEVKLVREKNSYFISDQNLLHRGWPQSQDGERLVLVLDSAIEQKTT